MEKDMAKNPKPIRAARQALLKNLLFPIRTLLAISKMGLGRNPLAVILIFQIPGFAGGGIKGGRPYGSTDETGANVTTAKTTAQDFNATIAYAMGLPHDKVITSPSKRPFRMGGKDGKPITGLFS